MPAKRTDPSKSLTNQAHGFKYTNAASTDLAKKFADMRRAAAKAEREAKSQAAAAAQMDLLTAANVLPLQHAKRKVGAA